MTILESKLSVPDHSPYIIRKRLFSFIENHLDRSLICLTSDGGYGKTTLISSFIQEKKLPAVWYYLSHLDRSPQTFLSYIKTAISREISGENMTYDIQQENIDEELDKIIGVLSTWPTRLIIVLDNYQSIDQSEEIERILTKMITHASSFITFIITSRIRPNLQLVRLKLQNKLAELKTKDLAFTKDEIIEFFSHLYNLPLHQHEINLIFDKTEGWVASLQLLQDVIKDKNEPERSLFWLKFSGTPDIPDIYDYLGTEIVASESTEIQDFLYKTCLLTTLNPEVINRFLGITDSNDIVDYLLKNHLFIYKTNSGAIKYHNLFRSFLYKELSKRYDKAEIDEDHKKLSTIYEQTYDYFNAFSHSVAGSDFLVAAKLMEKMKERYNSSRFLILIDGLLENILPDFSSASISLFLFRCIPLEIIKDLIVPLESKINDLNGTISPILLTHYQHQLAAMFFYNGEINKSEQLCNNSLNEALKIQDPEMISINLSLKSVIYWYMGKFEEAKQLAQESLAYPDTNNNFHPHHLALWILSEIYLELKELSKAESLIKETLKLSEEKQDCSIIYPYCSMGKYYRLKGQYQEALNWIKKAENIGIKFNLGYDLGWIYREMAFTYDEAEQWEEADYYLSKAEEYATHAIYLNSRIKQLQASVWGNMGKQELAHQKLKEFEKICHEKNFYWIIPEEKPKVKKEILVQDPKIHLSIQALGNLKIKINDEFITLKRKSSLRLLQYFISHRDSKLVKEKILDEVFSEGSFESINNQFYVALSYLRKTLEPDLKSGRDSLLFKQAGEHYTLGLDHIYLDVHEFTSLLQSKKASSPEERMNHLKSAERLYRGDYFEEYPYVSFVELERERLRVLYLDALKELASYYWNHSDYNQGMEYFDRILMKDPYQENVYEEYIQRLLESKLLLHAKKVSQLYEKFIEKELGIPVQDKLQKMFDHHS